MEIPIEKGVSPPCPNCHRDNTVKTRESTVTTMYLCMNCRYIFTVTKP